MSGFYFCVIQFPYVCIRAPDHHPLHHIGRFFDGAYFGIVRWLVRIGAFRARARSRPR